MNEILYPKFILTYSDDVLEFKKVNKDGTLLYTSLDNTCFNIEFNQIGTDKYRIYNMTMNDFILYNQINDSPKYQVGLKFKYYFCKYEIIAVSRQKEKIGEKETEYVYLVEIINQHTNDRMYNKFFENQIVEMIKYPQ